MKFWEALQALSEKSDNKTYGKGGKEQKRKAFKGRVINYKNIKDALSSGSPGDIFSTKNAARVYVISKAKWGKKSSGKIAKGFTPGSSTPSSDFPSVKKHAARTMLRHGRGTAEMAKRYGSRSIRKARGIGGKDGRLEKGEK